MRFGVSWGRKPHHISGSLGSDSDKPEMEDGRVGILLGFRGPGSPSSCSGWPWRPPDPRVPARRARRARRRRAAWGGKDCHRRRPEWNPWFSGSSTRILSVLGPDPRHDTPGPGTRKNRHFRRPGWNPWFSGSRHRIWSVLGPETRQNVSKGSVQIFERIFTMIPILRLAGSGSCLPGHSRSNSGRSLLPKRLWPSAASVFALSTGSPSQKGSTETVRLAVAPPAQVQRLLRGGEIRI